MLQLLPIAREAAFNADEKTHEDNCFEGTRIDVQKEINAWSDMVDQKCIFWLKGMAGTGKSTIARTVARRYSIEKRLGASFFFDRGVENISHTGLFFTTIARQLADTFPMLEPLICKILESNKDISRQTLRDQWEKLILGPLSELDAVSTQILVIIVIDALDECQGDDDIRLILQLLIEVKRLERIRLRFFITSRPETPIRLKFRNMPDILHHDLILHDVPRVVVDHDITVFLRVKFREIRENAEYIPVDWPGDETIDLLVKKSAGLFIYAATVCRFIKANDQASPRQLLQDFVLGEKPSSLSDQTNKKITAELDGIYTQILEHSIKRIEVKHQEEFAAGLRQVIGSIAVLSEPLSPTALGHLLSFDLEMIYLKLRHLRSVLRVSDDNNIPIRLLHPSFRDFLLDKERCSKPLFWINGKDIHRQLATFCVKLLSSRLKRDICNLQRPGISREDIEVSILQQCLPVELRYACQYWVHHLHQGGGLLHDNGEVHKFLEQHLLHWFEALSLIGKASQTTFMINLLGSMLDVRYRLLLTEYLRLI